MKKHIDNSIILTIIFAFTLTSIPQVNAAEVFVPPMPKPGVMVNLSPAFTPAHLKGMTVHPENPLQFDFLMDQGDDIVSEAQEKQEYTKIIKYFLASLTIADKDQWVNLSPYETNRIIENNFGKTEMGRDLLAQDYLLKQITSSLMYPESGLGKKFWDDVYAKAYKKFGNTNIPVNTINKVWIMPDEAVVYENKDSAIILKSHLKVMLEEDYLAINKNIISPPLVGGARGGAQSQASKAIKDIILPVLEKEINEGKNFAQLRQMVSAMILATWYKQALKESLLAKVYADKAKVEGVNQDPKANDVIYERYLAAFKKGVYSYIKEDEDKYTHERMPRKYFAGGYNNAMLAKLLQRVTGRSPVIKGEAPNQNRLKSVPTNFVPSDNAIKPIASSTIVDVDTLELGLLDRVEEKLAKVIFQDIQAGGSPAPVLAYVHAELKLNGALTKFELAPEESFNEQSLKTNWGGLEIPNNVGQDYDKEMYKADANTLRELYADEINGDFYMMFNIKAKTLYPMDVRFLSRFNSDDDWVALVLGHDKENKFKIRQSAKIKRILDFTDQDFINTYIARINAEFNDTPQLNPKTKSKWSDFPVTSILMDPTLSIGEAKQRRFHETYQLMYPINEDPFSKEIVRLQDSKEIIKQLGDIDLSNFYKTGPDNVIFDDKMRAVLLSLQMLGMIDIIQEREFDLDSTRVKYVNRDGTVDMKGFVGEFDVGLQGVVRLKRSVTYEALKKEIKQLIQKYFKVETPVYKRKVLNRIMNGFSEHVDFAMVNPAFEYTKPSLAINMDAEEIDRRMQQRFYLNEEPAANQSRPAPLEEKNSNDIKAYDEKLVKRALDNIEVYKGEYKKVKKDSDGNALMMMEVYENGLYPFHKLNLAHGTMVPVKVSFDNNVLKFAVVKTKSYAEKSVNKYIQETRELYQAISRAYPKNWITRIVQSSIGVLGGSNIIDEKQDSDKEIYVRQKVEQQEAQEEKDQELNIYRVPLNQKAIGINIGDEHYKVQERGGTAEIFAITDNGEERFTNAKNKMIANSFYVKEENEQDANLNKVIGMLLLYLQKKDFIALENNQIWFNDDFANSFLKKVMYDMKTGGDLDFELAKPLAIAHILKHFSEMRNFNQSDAFIAAYNNADGYITVEIETLPGVNKVTLDRTLPEYIAHPAIDSAMSTMQKEALSLIKALGEGKSFDIAGYRASVTKALKVKAAALNRKSVEESVRTTTSLSVAEHMRDLLKDIVETSVYWGLPRPSRPIQPTTFDNQHIASMRPTLDVNGAIKAIIDIAANQSDRITKSQSLEININPFDFAVSGGHRKKGLIDATVKLVEGVLVVDLDRNNMKEAHYKTTVGRLKKLEIFITNLNTEIAKNMKDSALVAKETAKGGIDFNAKNFSLDIKRDGKGMILPWAQQDMDKLSSIQGFLPQIIEIKSVTSLPILTELRAKLNSTP